MEKHRPEWSSELRLWIKQLIELSCRSGVVKSNDKWYAAQKGIPTGGVPCVDIGNISVYFVLEHLVYQQHTRPSQLVSLLRYVDDGLGFWKGSEETFVSWMSSLNESSTDQFGLSFTYEFFDTDQFANFLDISQKFEFD